MDQYFSRETFNLIIASGSFVVLLVAIFFIYRYVFKFLKRRVSLSHSRIDDFILKLFNAEDFYSFFSE